MPEPRQPYSRPERRGCRRPRTRGGGRGRGQQEDRAEDQVHRHEGGVGEEAGGEAVPVPEHGVRAHDAEYCCGEYSVAGWAVCRVGHREGGAYCDQGQADGEGLAAQGL